MDYFKILNLKKEPFSNSPEPEFFFHSSQHLGCLQNLELSIRLRRGLNVVIGDIGTGKTTLCRQLILIFSQSGDGAEGIETHLILDPSFSNAIEFLSTVAIAFGLDASDAEKSEWKLKENIKNHLFKKGIDDQKTVVLIIDEGQKLPDFCYELLREFLNYETNDHKLLQIIIFAQKEFDQNLQNHQNFSDRINQYYFLKPLNFREVRAMIRFRIAKACEGDTPPSLFNYPAFLAIYLETGGYPRKIVTLCHRIILTLLIQNRSKAGWFLVRSCAYRLFPSRPRMWRWLTGMALALFIAAAIGTVLVFDLPGLISSYQLGVPLKNLFISSPATPPVQEVGPGSPPDARKDGNGTGGGNQKESPDSETARSDDRDAGAPPSAVHNGPAGQPANEVLAPQPSSGPLPGAAAPAMPIPQLLGRITIGEGGNVALLLKRIYGYSTQTLLNAVAQVNPDKRSFSQVRAGDIINIPAIPLPRNPLLKERQRFWVQVTSKKNLEDAYRLMVNRPPDTPPLRLLTYRNSREGTVFALLLKNGFDDEVSAMNAITLLPPSWGEGSRVVSRWDADTVFYTN